jgi:pimeloyl-ACP methyl ester carboxylesterase
MGKSSHDITPITKEHRIQLAQNYASVNGEQDDIVQCEQDRIIPNVKAYKLLDEGKSPLEVASELNLPGPQVQQFYVEYWNMRRMHKLVTIYQETQDSMGYFLKLFRLGRENGVTPEQITKLVQMADSLRTNIFHRSFEFAIIISKSLIFMHIKNSSLKENLVNITKVRKSIRGLTSPRAIFPILIFLFAFSIMGSSTPFLATATATTEIENVYMVTTRGNRNVPQGVTGNGYGDAYPLGDINQLKRDCPEEIAIFVHGWHNDETKAKERLDRVKMSLEHNRYIIPLIGFSWDSNIEWEPAKFIAKQNGPKLAHFISDFKSRCGLSDVRVVAHSMGARVVLSSLESLHNNDQWNRNDFRITSIHLMGAAVDDEEVSKNIQNILNDQTNQGVVKTTAYGEAIQEEVTRFYNLYNPQDNMLQQLPFDPPYSIYEIYPFFEEDSALGQVGTQHDIHGIDKVSRPPYYDINVQNQIEPGTDADGIEDLHLVFCGFVICDETIIKGWDFGLCLAYYLGFGVNTDCRIGMGDNHAGYIGFRNNPANRNIDEFDGTMDVVVQHWSAPLQ